MCLKKPNQYIPLKQAISMRCKLIIDEKVTMNSWGNNPVEAQNVSWSLENKCSHILIYLYTLCIHMIINHKIKIIFLLFENLII